MARLKKKPSTYYLILLLLLFCITLLSVIGRIKTFNIYNSGVAEVGRRTKIGFLKTHKCASSSIQNILMRFGMKHNLSFVLPESDNYLGKHQYYKRSMIKETPWEKAGLNYSIFMLHTKWNHKEVSNTLNDNGDVVYFSILRDPIDLFISFWDYSAKDKGSLDQNVKEISIKGLTIDGSFGLNQMLRDFGMQDKDIFDKSKVLKKIQDIERKFHLIMMTERLSESVILMKDLLHWSNEDMVNFKLNAKDVQKKSQISQESREILKAVLWPDYLLYNHFSNLFDEKVKAFGVRRMGQELDDLNEATRKVKDDCIEAKISNNDVAGSEKLYGKDMMQYQTKSDASPLCRYYVLKENNFVDELRQIQLERATTRKL